jgi:hypothetical protein
MMLPRCFAKAFPSTRRADIILQGHPSVSIARRTLIRLLFFSLQFLKAYLN